jgi:hypothetical protein
LLFIVLSRKYIRKKKKRYWTDAHEKKITYSINILVVMKLNVISNVIDYIYKVIAIGLIPGPIWKMSCNDLILTHISLK